MNMPVTEDPQPSVQTPLAPAPATPAPEIAPKYLFDTPENARHSVRVIADEEGITYLTMRCPDGAVRNMKEVLCACLEQESKFNNAAIGRNKDRLGRVLSTDWGICQVNDYYHIGPGKDFPDVEYVVDNPDKAVRWMVRLFKEGKYGLWVSFSSGAYLRYYF